MSKTGENMTMRSSDAVEALLEHAEPRPAPPPEIEQEVGDTVRAEWQVATGARRRRRQIGGLAVAASLIVAVTVAFNLMNTGVAPVTVATIDKQHGSIMLEGERSGQVPVDEFVSVQTGQVLLTAANSAVGLQWSGGGSLRIDENTRVEFVSPSEVFLHSGRIYFDSAASQGSSDFLIQTPHGSVTHLGTQYMTESRPASLRVLVREGEVSVTGTFHDGRYKQST